MGEILNSSFRLGRADRDQSGEQDYSDEQVSAYYQELEQLIERIEKSSTHYQVLGVERLATTGEIKLAYLRGVALLNPSYFGITLAVPDHLLSRVDGAFEQVSRAYSMLVGFDRRVEYDSSLNRGSGSRLAANTTRLDTTKLDELKTEAGAPAAAPADSTALWSQAKVEERRAAEAEPNRRRYERFHLTIPASVTGYDRATGKWHEIAQTVDVSRIGISVRLRNRVRHGLVLQLTLPLPVKLRNHGYTDSTYNVYALVRRIEPTINGRRVVGLEFIGERPPIGYLSKPWSVFRSTSWTTGERRREARLQKSEAIKIAYLDESLKSMMEDIAFIEDLSQSGARVYIKSAPPEFEFVRIISPGRNFEGNATVCNRYVGNDGFERLCLRFVDSKWPASEADPIASPGAEG